MIADVHNARVPWRELAAKRSTLALMAIGGALVFISVLITLISPRYAPGVSPFTAENALLFAGLLALSGGVYLGLFRLLPLADGDDARQMRGHIPGSRPMRLSGALWTCIALGIAMRGIFFLSTPIFEDDWRRYLWDGAVIGEGVNPYRYAPAEASTIDPFGEPVALSDDPALRRLQQLDAAHADYPERVNYPFVTTIYPPVAQAAMHGAHVIAPFNLNAWRLILLIADCCGLFIMIRLLTGQGRDPAWALLYWWNPLVIYAGFNAAHMDILLVPALLAALHFSLTRKDVAGGLMTGGALALAAGIKFWPLLLAPILFAPWARKPRALVLVVAFTAALTALIMAPMVWGMMGGGLIGEGELIGKSGRAETGLAAYTSSWRTFSFLFTLLENALGLFSDQNDRIARVIIAALIAGVTGLVARKLWASPDQARGQKMISGVMVVTATLFFLAPSGYPWYAIWVLMVLPLVPVPAIGVLTVTLPLYYLRYWLGAAGHDDLLSFIVTPAAFAIPLALLLVQARRRHGVS